MGLAAKRATRTTFPLLPASPRLARHSEHRLPAGAIVGSVLIAALALLLAAWFDSASARLALVVAGLIAAAAWLLVAHLTSRRRHGPSRSLVVDDLGLSMLRHPGRVERLIRFRPGFGMSLFHGPSRDQWGLALTTAERTVCLAAHLSNHEKRRLADMHLPSTPLSAEELSMAAVLPDGEPMIVPGESLLCLIELLHTRDPSALERCYLSDVDGHHVVLTERTLRTRRHTFRLDEPFDWRASVFHECIGAANASFQATWVRQDQVEVVLVSLLGGDTRRPLTDWSDISDVHRLEGPSGPPPPRDKRVAVDRLFMLPLRAALERARLAHCAPIPDASAPKA